MCRHNYWAPLYAVIENKSIEKGKKHESIKFWFLKRNIYTNFNLQQDIDTCKTQPKYYCAQKYCEFCDIATRKHTQISWYENRKQLVTIIINAPIVAVFEKYIFIENRTYMDGSMQSKIHA